MMKGLYLIGILINMHTTLVILPNNGPLVMISTIQSVIEAPCKNISNYFIIK